MKLSKIGKKGQNASGIANTLIIVVLALLAYSLLGGNTNFLGTATAPGGVSGTGGGTTTVNVVGDKACASTTVSLPNTNALARGTAPNQFTRLFLNSDKGRVDKGQVADAGTLRRADPRRGLRLGEGAAGATRAADPKDMIEIIANGPTEGRTIPLLDPTIILSAKSGGWTCRTSPFAIYQTIKEQ